MHSNPATRPLFRLLFPLIIGCIVYLLVLLAFDTVNRILEDFFNKELLVCISMSYLILECNRLLTLVFRKKLQQTQHLLAWMLSIVIFALVTTFILTSSALIFYFHQVEQLTNITSFATELKVFNGIFLFIVLLYHAYFLGFVWLHQQFQLRVANEEQEKEILNSQIHHFHYMLHPDFLLSGLEAILLSLKEKKIEKADDAVVLLSEIYQYLLRQHEELVPLEEEIRVIKKIENFLIYYNHYYVKVEFSIWDYSSLIIPRALVRLFESIISSQLSSKQAPLNISIEQEDDQLILSFLSNFSLINGEKLVSMLQQVRLQYNWLGREVYWEEKECFKIYIPTAKAETLIVSPELI